MSIIEDVERYQKELENIKSREESPTFGARRDLDEDSSKTCSPSFGKRDL